MEGPGELTRARQEPRGFLDGRMVEKMKASLKDLDEGRFKTFDSLKDVAK